MTGAAVTQIALPPVVDRESVALLLLELRKAIQPGAGITLAADHVDQIGQAGLQLLLSAVRSAADVGADLAVCDPSPALLAAVDLAGLREHLPIVVAG